MEESAQGCRAGETPHQTFEAEDQLRPPNTAPQVVNYNFNNFNRNYVGETIYAMKARAVHDPQVGFLAANGGPESPETSEHDQHRAQEDIKTQREALAKKLREEQFYGDIENLVEDHLLALIRGDPSEKTTLDLITIYNEERASLPTSFYDKHHNLKELHEGSWRNYFLDVASTTCGRHLEDTEEMKRVSARTCTTLSRQLQEQNNDKFFMDGFVSRADDTYSMAEDFASSKKLIHSAFSFYTAAELYALAKNGDDSVKKVSDCAFRTNLIAREMAKEDTTRSLVVDHVIPLMTKMRDSIRSIYNSSRAIRVEKEAWCSCFIGVCYWFVGKFRQSPYKLEFPIELLRTEFGEKAKNFRGYGYCLQCAGDMYYEMEDITQAYEFTKLALEAYENALDWESDEVKNSVIREMGQKIVTCEAKLGK